MLRAADIEKIRYKNLELATSLLVRAALARGITVEVLPDKLVRLKKGSTTQYIMGRSLPCNSVIDRAIANNKYLTHHILRTVGIPTPRSILLRNPGAWKHLLSSARLTFPMVVKPTTGSHGLGSTMNIREVSVLHRAVERAFNYMKKKEDQKRVLVEEYFEGGHDLRILVVGGKVISVVERDPAHVIGDGIKTIRQLMDEFNHEWKTKIDYDLPLCPIPLDAETTRRLKSQNLTLASIPQKDQKIYMRWNANVSMGGRSIERTDEVSKEIKALAVRCAELIGLKVTGVDILARDFTSSDISAKNLTVLELNHAPGFDINQVPYQGTGRDVAGVIIDLLFANTSA
ncbi:MAG: hypothetical protein HYR90_03255 [Candidatus Andersenbacteria bacterium]|nr:hypothetical protein [Candidatus Andersenbacteria bacterium]MBI3250282.1 hypothetical protein [Candidatus Andersenbacteria bacterium]